MMKATKKALGAFGFAVAALILVGAGCGQGASKPSPAQSGPTSGTVKGGEAPAPSSAMPVPGSNAADTEVRTDGTSENSGGTMAAARTISITAKQFTFDPPEIRVKQGEKVKLVLVSEDVTHGFSLPAFGINETLEAGKTVTAEFTADKKGTFPFNCSVFCGSGHGGMRGTLVVQ